MPIDLKELFKPIPEKGVAPEKGFCIYFPLINQDWFQVPEKEQERVIAHLEKKISKSNPTIKGLRAALEDYVFPLQKVILVIENSKTLVFTQDLLQTDEGEFYFEPDEFIKQYPSIESLMKGQQVTTRDWLENWETHLNKVRKNHRKHTLTNIPLKIGKASQASRAKGFGGAK